MNYSEKWGCSGPLNLKIIRETLFVGVALVDWKRTMCHILAIIEPPSLSSVTIPVIANLSSTIPSIIFPKIYHGIISIILLTFHLSLFQCKVQFMILIVAHDILILIISLLLVKLEIQLDNFLLYKATNNHCY